MRAFFTGENPPRVLRATVVRIETLEPSVAFAYDLRDDAGSMHRLTWRAREPMQGVAEGAPYEFEVEFVGGSPPISSIVVRDGRGLVFAAFAGQTPRNMEGFTIALRDSGCPSRAHGECYDSIVNQKLVVSRGTETVELMNGQAGELGGYRVYVLTAQKVTYNGRCADAGVDGVAVAVSR